MPYMYVCRWLCILNIKPYVQCADVLATNEVVLISVSHDPSGKFSLSFSQHYFGQAEAEAVFSGNPIKTALHSQVWILLMLAQQKRMYHNFI